MKKILLALCFLLIALAVALPWLGRHDRSSQTRFEQAWNGSGNIEPGGVQGVTAAHPSVQPLTVIGLVASLAGALILGLSVIVMSRQKAQAGGNV